MFNFEIHNNYEAACQALDFVDEGKMIPGTMYHIYKYKDEYRIGYFGRLSTFYKLKKNGDRLSAKSNGMAGFTIIFMGVIAFMFVLLLLKAVIAMLISSNYEYASSLLIIFGIIVFFGMFAIFMALSLKAIRRTIDSLIDTSYYDMTTSANPKLAVFENSRNKPLMDNTNVTVRRESGKYVVGSFGAVPYYYIVICDNNRIDYKLGASSYVRIIYSTLLAIALGAVEVFLICGTMSGSLTGTTGGIIVFGALTLIGLLWACVPLFYRKAIRKFISNI